LQSLPQFFEASNKLNVLRADRLGDEFGVQYIIRGGGDEYQRIEEVKATKAPLLIQVNFPNALQVDDPQDVVMIPLADMKHWELAPSNPAAISKAGIPFSLTTGGLKDKKEFWANVRKAIGYGLPEKEALKALTLTPAQLIKADHQIGSLKKGMLANFIITSDNLFHEQTTIYENWVQGYKYVVNAFPVADIRGMYDLKVGDQSGLKLLVSGKAGSPDFAVQSGKDTLKVKANRTASNLLTLTYSPDKKSKKGETRLSGWMKNKTLKGEGITAEGTPVNG
jgi:hypothetical protein